MVMTTIAEQNKQHMIKDAKRLSYQEQISWANDASGPYSSVVYYPNKATAEA